MSADGPHTHTLFTHGGASGVFSFAHTAETGRVIARILRDVKNKGSVLLPATNS